MPDVSVIIPTWNRSALLEDAIRSALAQTIQPLEVLVCDDGSTDRSEEAVRALGDRSLHWVPGARGGGPAIPRNRGIRESRGEWIAFLDDDDEWLPDKLERQLGLAKRLGCRAVCCNAVRFVPGRGDSGNYLAGGDFRITFNDLVDVNRVICSSALIHRSLMEKVEGFPEGPEMKALEDYAFWLRVAVFTDFAYVDEPLLRYRDEAHSSVRSGGVDVWEQRRRVFGDFLSWGERSAISAACMRKLRKQLMLDEAERFLERVAKPLKVVKKVLFK